MNMRITLAAASAALAVAGTSSLVAGGGNPQPGIIDVFTMSGGGSAQTPEMRLDLTVGEPLAGTVAADGMQLRLGFWAVISEAPMSIPCPADITGNGEVEVSDLLLVINNWNAGPGNVADITGDGVVNVSDLLAVINAWGACP